MRKVLEAISLIILFLLAGWVSPATAEGLWQAQVVDAETKQPLEGVVVLAVWYKHVRDFGGASSEYHDSEEVLTDKEGRFTIVARSFFSFNPFVYFTGPEFTIFKPGYGRRIWPGYQGSDKWPEEKRKQLSQAAQLFQLVDIVLEMPRLRTLEERKVFMKSLDYAHLPCCFVPHEKIAQLRRALDEDRVAVGLPPGYSK